MNYKKFLGAASAALMIVIVINSDVGARRLGSKQVQNAVQVHGGNDGAEPYAGLIFDLPEISTARPDGGLTARWHRLQAGPERGRKLDRERAVCLCSLARVRRGRAVSGPDLRPGRKSLRHDPGRRSGLGTVFQANPEPDGSWTESVLYSSLLRTAPTERGPLPA